MQPLMNLRRYAQPKGTIGPGLSILLGVLSVAMVAQSGAPAVAALAAANAAVSPAGAPRLQSLRITGTVSLTNMDGSKSSRPVELRIVIPSSYFRIERAPDVVRQSGFSGATLLNDLKAHNPSAQVVVHYPPDQIDMERARVRRLLLGIAAIVTSDSGPTSVEPTVIDGRAVDLIRLTDVRIKELRLGVGRSDHLPLVVVVTQSVVLPGKPGEDVSLQLARRETLDVQQWFEDRRLVSGHRLPFLIRTVAGGVELERLAVGTIEVNPVFGPRDFDK